MFFQVEVDEGNDALEDDDVDIFDEGKKYLR
jgi:hypothetical protein